MPESKSGDLVKARLFVVVPTLSSPSRLVALLLHLRRIRRRIDCEPSAPVRKDWGLAVRGARMLPEPPAKGWKFMMRSYLTRSLFPPPERCGHLVVDRGRWCRRGQSWTAIREINCARDKFGSDREGQFVGVVPVGGTDSSGRGIFLKMRTKLSDLLLVVCSIS